MGAFRIPSLFRHLKGRLALAQLPADGIPSNVITGLGGAAGLAVGQAPGTVAAGDDSRFVALAGGVSANAAAVAARLVAASNFSDVPNKPTAIDNLGLGSISRLRGWSIIGMNSNNCSRGNNVAPGSVGAGAKAGCTAALMETSPVSASRIMFVLTNYQGNSNNGEIPAFNDIFARVSATNVANSEVYRATFGGGRRGQWVKSRHIVPSDPLNFQVARGVPYQVRPYAGVVGSTMVIPANITTLGGTGTNGQGLSEGVMLEDRTGHGTLTGGVAAAYGPAIILGYTGINPAPSLGLLGDSRFDGTGDGGARPGSAGWGVRVAHGAFSAAVDYTTLIPVYGHVNVARGGEQLTQFLAALKNRTRLELLAYATTVLCNYLINDISIGLRTLAQIKADVLTLAGLIYGQRQKLIMCSLEPQTTSTNGWVTPGAQTVRAWESVRTGYNDWLRDATSTGFKQQAMAATGAAAKWFDSDMSADVLEVNAAGVQAVNGGFWKPPSAAVYTGSVTTGGSASTLTDTALAIATRNTYRGYTVVVTSGPNAGACGSILYSTTGNVLAFSSAFGSVFATGNTYSVYANLSTVDGTHNSSFGHGWRAQAFNTGLVV